LSSRRQQEADVSVELHIINAHAHGPSQLGESERPRSHLRNPKSSYASPARGRALFLIGKAFKKSKRTFAVLIVSA
jgi:hypothetical protein